MTVQFTPERAAALLAAQGITGLPENNEAVARFATVLLAKSAAPFARLAFEDEPSGYTAAMRSNSP